MNYSLEKQRNRTEQIRKLNDTFRRREGGLGMIVSTPGIREGGADFLEKVSKAVITFDTFTEDNDPHGEHDFGALDVDGKKIFWKFDYYDLSMTVHSPDAANPALTRRVLTIMLACEY